MGVVDWHKQQLGKVEQVVLQKKRAFIGTASNVIASVALRTGEIGMSASQSLSECRVSNLHLLRE